MLDKSENIKDLLKGAASDNSAKCESDNECLNGGICDSVKMECKCTPLFWGSLCEYEIKVIYNF